MGHRLALAVALLLVTAAPAAADIIVDRPPPGAPKPVTESPKTPPHPVDEVVEKKGGCRSSRDNGIEWLFGLGVLTLGVVGLRHVAPRPPRRALES